MRIFAIFLLVGFCSSCKTENRKTDAIVSIEEKLLSEEVVSKSEVTEQVAELSQKEQKSEKKPSDIPQILSWNELYQRYQKPPQTFIVQTNKVQVIECTQGTRISIPANAFVFENSGKLADGNVKVSVREYYRVSDMLLNNLSTMSNGEILETGGMIYIEAEANGKKVQLDKNKAIEIAFPAKEKKDDMQLFLGERNKNNQMNWILENTEVFSEKEAIVSILVEEKVKYEVDQAGFLSIIQRNIRVPEKAIMNRMNGTVVVNGLINQQGNVVASRVVRGLDPEIDQEIAGQILMLPNLSQVIAFYTDGNISLSIPVKIRIDDFVVENFHWDTQPFLTDSTFERANSNEITNYILKSSLLGWINCDRFIRDRAVKQDFLVKIDAVDCDVKIIFHSIKSILPAKLLGKGLYAFLQVPQGEKITILAIKKIEGKPFLAVKDATITNEIISDLNFRSFTFEELESEIVKLNKLF